MKILANLWEGCVEVYTDLALSILEAVCRFGATAGVMAGIYVGIKLIPKVNTYLGL